MTTCDLQTSSLMLYFKMPSACQTHDEIDLGPAILGGFPSWPRHIKSAYELWLIKTSDDGFSIKLAPPPDSFWLEEALEKPSIT